MAARITAYLVAFIVGLTFIAGLLVGAQRDQDGPVDLIVVNGNVYTADGDRTMAEAVAVQGNKILMVGSNREVQRLRRAQTVVVDAKGGAVLPGFNDGHAHIVSGGLGLKQINLLDAHTVPAIETAVKAWATKNPDSEWVVGRGWYYEPFAGGLPTRQMLDALVPGRPAYLTAYDGHTAWANTAALKLAQITRRTPNPANGIIVKDPATGEPTGVLKEAAMGLVSALIPKPTRAEQLEALRAVMQEAHRRGITSVHTASGTAEEIDLFSELRRSSDLALRIYAAVSAGDELTAAELEAFEGLRDRYGDDPLLKSGAVKIIADGVIETHTAAMLEPYTNLPSTRGEPRMPAARLNQMVAELDRRGWQVMIHAIGDRGVRMALDALEFAAGKNEAPARGRRHRIEHIETIDPADVPRFGALGVIASMQPYHSMPDPSSESPWRAAIGEPRASRGWMYNSIAKSGGRLVFGSDWPVLAMDPLLGLFVAVNRTNLQGKPEGGWVPSERLPLPQAIDAYTRSAAWASFDEHRKGAIERDMLADLVILSEDVFALPPARLAEAEVAVTIFDGKVVYRRAADSND